MQTNVIYYEGDDILLPLPDVPKILSKSPITTSKYIKLQQVKFIESGCTRIWDVSDSHDSVAVLLYHVDKDSFVFVRQFRVSVFLKNGKHGYMYELCAGLCDKDIDIREIAIQEIEEECGYHIDVNRLHKIAEFYSSVGNSGAIQNLFYAEISDCDKKSSGGGNCEEGENIDIVFVPRRLVNVFLQDLQCPKTQSLAYAIMWFQTQGIIK